MTGLVRRWLDSPRLPPRANALRQAVAQRWLALLNNPRAVVLPGGGIDVSGGGGGGAGFFAGNTAPPPWQQQQQPAAAAAAQTRRAEPPTAHTHIQYDHAAGGGLGATATIAAAAAEIRDQGRTQDERAGGLLPSRAMEGARAAGGAGGVARAGGGAVTGAAVAGAAPVRASLEAVRRFVAFTTAARPAQQQQQNATVENIKAFFAGWVDPGACRCRFCLMVSVVPLVYVVSCRCRCRSRCCCCCLAGGTPDVWLSGV